MPNAFRIQFRLSEYIDIDAICVKTNPEDDGFPLEKEIEIYQEKKNEIKEDCLKALHKLDKKRRMCELHYHLDRLTFAKYSDTSYFHVSLVGSIWILSFYNYPSNKINLVVTGERNANCIASDNSTIVNLNAFSKRTDISKNGTAKM